MPLSLDFSQQKIGGNFVKIARIVGNPNSSNLVNLNKDIKRLLRETKLGIDLILDCEDLARPSRKFFDFVEEWDAKLRKKKHRLFLAGAKMRNPEILCFTNLQQAKVVCFKSIPAEG